MARKLSAPVSRVERPAPTTNMLPQKPPKEALTPLGQKRRQPIVMTHRLSQLGLVVGDERVVVVLPSHECHAETESAENPPRDC